jgi:hypothetical protein
LGGTLNFHFLASLPSFVEERGMGVNKKGVDWAIFAGFN